MLRRQVLKLAAATPLVALTTNRKTKWNPTSQRPPENKMVWIKLAEGVTIHEWAGIVHKGDEPLELDQTYIGYFYAQSYPNEGESGTWYMTVKGHYGYSWIYFDDDYVIGWTDVQPLES